jgi:hypothetical protein
LASWRISAGCFKVVIDVPAAGHDRQVGFWEAALGQPLPQFDYPEYQGAALHGHDFWLLTQRLGSGTALVHLDIHSDDLDAEVARLGRLGARPVQRVHSWQVIRDPAGADLLRHPGPARHPARRQRPPLGLSLKAMLRPASCPATGQWQTTRLWCTFGAHVNELSAD